MDWANLYQDRMRDAAPMPAITQVRMPRPPRAIADLARLADGRDATAEAICKIVEPDSELTLQVLKLVNSAAQGMSSKVRTVRRAIDLLGPRRSKMLVMSAMLQASMGSAKSTLIQEDAFLSECLERAFFARFAAIALGVDAECTYLSGLLQDLLLPCLFAEYRKQYEKFVPGQGSLVEYEQQTFGWNHAALTARLLKDWAFPDDVVCCVLFHHDAAMVQGSDELGKTVLAATSAGALLPETLHQELNGIARLLEFQNSVPQFNFLELSVQVDEQFEQGYKPTGHRTGLCDRLSRLAVAHLEQKRIEDNWTERTVGSYTLEEEIGQGAMGVVYRARHSKLRRPAAVKLMKTALVDPQAIERFEIEAQLTSALTNPHTVRIYDYGTTPQGVLYYAMEYLKGLSIRELVDLYGAQPEGRAIHILRQVCSSLAEAHSTGLIHRDIKAENIYLTVHGGTYDFAKVLDFGLAKMSERNDDPIASQRAVCGTPAYLSPEAILHPELVDSRTDIYALGTVAYYLVSGEMPFEENEFRDVLLAQLNQDPERPSRRLGRPISTDLEEIVMSCLRKDPEDRPESVSRLSELLRKCRAAETWTPEAALGWWLLHVNSRPVVAERSAMHSSTFINRSFHASQVLQPALVQA